MPQPPPPSAKQLRVEAEVKRILERQHNQEVLALAQYNNYIQRIRTKASRAIDRLRENER